MKPKAPDGHGRCLLMGSYKWRCKSFFQMREASQTYQTYQPYATGFPVIRWCVGKRNICSFTLFLSVSRKGNVWRWQDVIGFIKSSLSWKWEGSNASSGQPHSSNWFHRNDKLTPRSSVLKRIEEVETENSSVTLHAVMAAADKQVMSGQETLALTQTAHSDSRTQIYSGCLVNAIQFHEGHLEHMMPLSSSQWAWCPRVMDMFGHMKARAGR